jgi:branched-subunit amino acid transport protein
MSAADLYLLGAILAAAAANGIWRVLGVLLASRVDEHSPIFAWVRMVATALVAALVSQLVLNPAGSLAGVPLWLRVGCVGFGAAVYYAMGRSVAFGILAGEAALIGTLLIAQ